MLCCVCAAKLTIVFFYIDMLLQSLKVTAGKKLGFYVLQRFRMFKDDMHINHCLLSKGCLQWIKSLQCKHYNTTYINVLRVSTFNLKLYSLRSYNLNCISSFTICQFWCWTINIVQVTTSLVKKRKLKLLKPLDSRGNSRG